MSGNYLTPKFWCTGCTILVHRVHRVHHFGTQGAQGAPFWYTGCTILVHRVHRVHHFGTQGAPFWYTGCTILVHRVHHFGTQGAPFWYTGCTILVHRVHHFGTQGAPSRVRYPFALPHNSPKTNPIPETPLQIITGLLRKAPQKPPPGLTARLSSPPTYRLAPAGGGKKLDGYTTPRQGQPSTRRLLTTTTPRQDLQRRQNPKHHHDSGHPRQATQSNPPFGPNRAVLGHPAQTQTSNTAIRQNRQETFDPTTSGTQDRTLHTAAPNRTCLVITPQNILTSSHSHHPINLRLPGPALRAGPNHLSSVF